MCVSKNSITAVSSETGRGIEKVKPLYVPQHGPVDVALVLVGLLISFNLIIVLIGTQQ